MTAYATTSYTYNGDGQRMSKKTGHTTEPFTWEGPSTGTVPALLADGATDYLYDPDGLPLEQINGTTTLYYLHDQLGSTRLLTSSAGLTVAAATYTDYGAVTASTGTTTNPLGYTSAYTDPESGLQYLQHRYYDPTTAQLVSVDPLADQTGQPYTYADGDPLDETDPLGLGCSILATLNPFSSNNCIRTWASGGSLAAEIALKSNPAYLAVSGYANEAHAYENGCSPWTVAAYGAEGALGVALTGLIATEGAALATGQALGDVAYQSPLLGPDSALFGNSSLGQTLRSGFLNPPGRGAWRLGWSVNRNLPGFRLKAAGSYRWLFHASGF